MKALLSSFQLSHPGPPLIRSHSLDNINLQQHRAMALLSSELRHPGRNSKLNSISNQLLNQLKHLSRSIENRPAPTSAALELFCVRALWAELHEPFYKHLLSIQTILMFRNSWNNCTHLATSRFRHCLKMRPSLQSTVPRWKAANNCESCSGNSTTVQLLVPLE
jgi:hypothetical protein